MYPRPTVNDLPDRRFGYSELCGDDSMACAVRDESADLTHVIVGEDRVGLPFATAYPFRVDMATVPVTGRDALRMGTTPMSSPAGHETGAGGVSEVLADGRPLQVVCPIVTPIPVNVVDVRPARIGSQECLCDKPMYGSVVPSHSDTQNNASVATGTVRGKDVRLATFAPDPPHVGDGVEALVPHNGKPAFGGIFGFSHGEPPQKVPVVRSGWDVDASRRAALYSTSSAEGGN